MSEPKKAAQALHVLKNLRWLVEHGYTLTVKAGTAGMFWLAASKEEMSMADASHRYFQDALEQLLDPLRARENPEAFVAPALEKFADFLDGIDRGADGGEFSRDPSDGWEAFAEEIENLLTDPGETYEWARETLEGIFETVVRTQRVTERQRTAVANITAAGRRRPSRWSDYGD